MSDLDRYDQQEHEDIAPNNTVDNVLGSTDDDAGTAGALTAGLSAANASGGGFGGASGVGAAIVGGMAARDLVEDANGPVRDADLSDSPDGYAGGGMTSAGFDKDIRDAREE